ncbi:hypothetical protein TUMSATVNIG1_24980 [Vibrio nigripulchritudo]|uniref:hypothetical protein n=1 Tax=Vibrio nigripulchritudo TaxID=28173 RepID=UPI0019090906|nr:hypothetical protein [Vibrio nigripulchritudo]BCL70536.1 hypothetical protein VNTUMSATTG_24730 [Vibrio nigripulchritudo]BDU31889.1 hypothetical protein TUMSATVNIG1_24980 [Vibrio nigripulchritudo]
MNIRVIVLLAILAGGSAFMNAYNTVGDTVEQAIAFVTPLLAYIAIIALVGIYQKVKIFSDKFISYFSVFFILFTILENVYPMYLYRDQTLPNDYLVLFFLQLLLNIYIVKVIRSEQNSQSA